MPGREAALLLLVFFLLTNWQQAEGSFFALKTVVCQGCCVAKAGACFSATGFTYNLVPSTRIFAEPALVACYKAFTSCSASCI